MMFFYVILFFTSYFLVKIYSVYARRKGVIDIPNERSSHSTPTPRGGGLVYIVLWECLLLWALVTHYISLNLFLYYFLPSVIIAGISFLDDNINLLARWRFLAQLLSIVIALVVLGGLTNINFDAFDLSLAIINLILFVLFSLWSTNLFNFMDGTDGLAAVQGIFVFGIGGILLYLNGAYHLSFILWSLVALIAGFLVCNWPKAKVFMGDVGSATLGLLVAITGFYAQQRYQIPFILWLMLYGLFLFDATITLMRRCLHKDKWYQAHRLHAYQRLHQSGFSHTKLLWAFIVVNTIISIIVFVAYFVPLLALPLALLEVAMLCIIYFIIERRHPMYSKLC